MKLLNKYHWLALVVLALVLRLAQLGAESLWYDEAYTLWLAKLDIPHLAKAISGDVHPPLWYAIEWLVIRVFGTSETALRFPAALFGVGTVLLVWRVALASGLDRSTAFAAGILASVGPVSIYYSQEARMYTMLAMFVLIMVWGALRGNGLAFIVGAVGTVYSQNLGVAYVVAVGLFLLYTNRNQATFRKWCVCIALTVLLWLPWGIVELQQIRTVTTGFWMPSLTLAEVFQPLIQMTMGWRIPDALQIHVYAAGLAATLAALWSARRWIKRQGALIAVAAFGAPALIAVASFLWRPVYLPRAFFPSALLIMIFWAWLLMRLAPGNRTIARAVLIPALLLAVLAHYFPAPAGARFDYRSFDQPVLDGWQKGDIVWHNAVHSAVAFQTYLPNKDYAIRPYETDLSVSLTPTTTEGMQLRRAAFDDLAKQGYRRAWLMLYTSMVSSNAELAEIDRILRAYPNRLIEEQQATNSTVAIYLVQLGVSQ